MKNLGIALMLLLGLTLIAGCGNKDTDEPMDTDDVTVEEGMNQEKFEGTIKDVYKKGGEVTCTMTLTQDGMQMNGKLYMDGKNMRTDFESDIQGMKFSMSTITKGENSYTWNSMSNEGWKMEFDEDEMEDGDDVEETDGTNMEVPMTFNCDKGVDNDNIFDLPNNITFKEFTY